MAAASRVVSVGTEGYREVADLLGGPGVLRHQLVGPLDVHDLLVRGLPGEALFHLVDVSKVLRKPDLLERAVGLSLRTIQRRREMPAKPLSQEQSARVWAFAKILAKATSVFGSQGEAEQWLERPAIGLDGRRPIDLLATPEGVELVASFLERIDYGVYT